MARMVTVAAVAWSAAQGQTVDAALVKATDLLRQAAVARPDLVIFPELFLHAGLPLERWTGCDPLPNPLTDHWGAQARKHALNLVVPMPVRIGERCFNCAVVLDRQGRIVGHYAKTHPTTGELKAGITPGTGPVVHQLDIGRITNTICFDINFPGTAEQIQDLDVDLVCFHSMFAAGQMLNQWALTCGACVLSAYHEESRLVDMTGQDLAAIGHRYEACRSCNLLPVLTGQLNFDRRLFHLDYNVADFDGQHGGLHRLLAECPDRVTVDYNFSGGVFALGAREGVSLADLVRCYGLESRCDYFRRTRRAETEVRATLGSRPA